MEKQISQVLSVLDKAGDGDSQALKNLNLHEGFTFDGPEEIDSKGFSDEKMKRDMGEMAFHAAALQRLGLDRAAKMAEKGLTYVMYVSRQLRKKTFKLKSSLDGSDLAADMHTNIKDICRSVDMLREVNEIETARIQGEGASEGQGDEEEQEGESAEGESAEEESAEEESAEEHESVEQATKRAAPSSHHLNRRCVVKGCKGYQGPNLKRHLRNVHVRKNDIFDTDVDKYFAMGAQSRKKRGPPRKTKAGKTIKGRWKRWCPEPNCKYIGPYLPEHLQNFHKMKRTSTHYKLCLKVAKRYVGLAGELDNMEQPEPAIVQISNPPSPYSASSSPPASPPPKRAEKAPQLQSDDDSDDEIVPPTPQKRPVSAARAQPAPPSTSSSAPPSAAAAPSSAPPTAAAASHAKSRAKPSDAAAASSSTAPPSAAAAPSSAPPTAAAASHAKSRAKPSDAAASSSTAPPSAAGPSSSAAAAAAAAQPPSAQLSAPPSDQEEDDDESDYPLVEDFFLEKDPKTNRHKWLVLYYRHLFTPNAGFHKERNRLQHASQVRRIIEQTDPNGDDISFMADDEGSRIWIDWVVPKMKTLKPGTVKSYLTSLEIFINYVTKKGKHPHLPPLDPDVKDQLFDLGENLKKWRRCVTKETSAQKWDRYQQESETLLSTDDVHNIMESEPAVEGRKALQAADLADSVDDLSIAQYCAARDFLLVTLTRAAGTRPGPLETATISMFNTAEWDDKNRWKVMLVSSHKRQEDGPAPIPMAPDVEYMMRVFIKKLRPLVCEEEETDDNTSVIFLKLDGAPFQKGTIGRRVTAFIAKSGIRPDKLMSATDFRKWLVTEMKRRKRQGLPVDEELMRRVMCHSDRTANEWYMRESLREQAAEAAEMIKEYTQPSSTGKKEEQDCPPKEFTSSPNPSASPSEPASPASPSKEASTSKQASSSSKSAQSPYSLTKAQIKCIKNVFADDISQGVEPRKKRIVALMKTEPALKSIVHSEPHVKKVIDRVRYLYQTREMIDPYQLPEENAAVRTASYVLSGKPLPPPSSVDSGRVEWSDEETDLIRKALKGWTKCPRNTEIRALFSKTPSLQKILKANTFERVRNKVKNVLRSLSK